MGTITLSDRQQRRVSVLTNFAAGEIDRSEAAELLGISERQVLRALIRFRTEGVSSVVHGNAGRVPPNRTSETVRSKLRELTCQEKEERGPYHDFNTCHLHELLAEREGIHLGRSTLDRLLKEAGTRKRRRGRPRGSFKRRERMPQEGQMLLTDASSHDWLERRDPSHARLCLHGAVDDATGKAVHLRFWPTECQAGYITMAREVATNPAYGIPMSFYHDRHTILCSPKEQTIDDELAGREPMSQFEAILERLGAQSIKALTPQAKGRVERMWQTLQDRLIKEMRLAGVTTMEEANAFLPAFIERYNNRFAVEPKQSETAWVKPEEALDLPFYFAVKEERTVRADHTLAWRGKTLLIKRKRGERSLDGVRVQVHTTPEGERFLYHGKTRLVFKALAERPKPQPQSTSATTVKEEQDPQKRRTARRRQMHFVHQGAGPCGLRAGKTTRGT